MDGWMLSIERESLIPGMKGEDEETGWTKGRRPHPGEACAPGKGREARFCISGRKKSKDMRG